MDVFKSFVLGTSILAAIPHLLIVGFIKNKTFDFSYKWYSILAPLYFGLMNALSVMLAKRYNWSLSQRLLYISFISIAFIVSLNYFISSRYYKPYSDYKTKDWLMYVLKNGALHLFVFNMLIYHIEKLF
jgi:hypothetical protein